MGSSRTGEGNREESDRTPVSARTSDLYAFGPYRLDVRGRILAREGQVVPLPPKTFELLLLMAQSLLLMAQAVTRELCSMSINSFRTSATARSVRQTKNVATITPAQAISFNDDPRNPDTVLSVHRRIGALCARDEICAAGPSN